MKIAIIDTGTNSTRLLIAEMKTEGLEELVRLTEVTRLGEGVDGGSRLHSEAKQRVRKCVDRYAEQIKAKQVERTIVLATSSVRDASDGENYLRSLATGHEFEWKLLTGEEEASLSFSGAVTGVSKNTQVTLFDVGGGSTEVVSGRDDVVEFAHSLDLGCVRVTERYIKSDPPAQRELDEARGFIEDLISNEIDLTCVKKADRAIAVAGTATALAAIDLQLERYERNRVQGHKMSLERVGEILGGFSGMTEAQKLKIKTMEQGRADVIVAGTMILECLMRYMGAKVVEVSELDILNGAALAAMEGRI